MKLLTSAAGAVTKSIGFGEEEDITRTELQLAWVGGTVAGMAIQGARHNAMVKSSIANGTEIRPFKALLF